ncbi:unnamed protein product [Cochlearia groenlandica]
MTKEEDEANNNNDEYICGEDDYNIKEEEEEEEEEEDKSQAWGTWEELLLACAVKRHGFTDWISVATEVRSRSSISGFFTSANNCQQKYLDLKRRFLESAVADVNDVAAAEGDGGEEKLPWLEQLRSLRVAELRREVQQYDESILSLQIKVKKLEEEEEKPDLEEEEEERRGGERSGNDGSESDHREKTEEESERENRSMNESNSTTSGGKIVGEDNGIDGDEPSQTRDDSVDNKPYPVFKAEEEGSEVSHSDESGTSGRKRRVNHGGFGGGKIRSTASKSQPLICLLDLIRSHPRGSLFERRLRSQETNDYNSLVKQHLDIETIHRNLRQGSYDSSSLSFYRDLQVLFTNAIVFFPSSSSESMAAHELRTIVSEEISKEIENFRTEADAETSDSSLSKQKSSIALVVCKKRSIVSPSSSSFSQREDTLLSEEKENIVTGVRNSRRASKAVNAVSKTGRGGKSSKQETVKTENTKKKTVSSDKKKSVADFLKRLKNSPQKENKEQSKKESKSKTRELRSNNNNVSKKKAETETTPSKRAPGRPQKKTVEAAATATASGKRGRESGSTEKDNKQPKKRSRR